MKTNRTKRTIYFRIVCAFFAIYLVLMAGFSLFLVSQEKKLAGLALQPFAFQVNNTVEDVLQDHLDSNHQITDIATFLKIR
ncbi:MAG: hypothetical protein GX434_03165 [Peptococcaceae bacterium]|nr:hypothetical protein [Peptococcaceae bacterium]